MKKFHHYIVVRGEVLPTLHNTTTAVVTSKISGEMDPSEIERTYKIRKTADSVLLSLFMRTNGKCKIL